MPTIAELNASDKIKALVYGPSKRGKTFGALTFPRVNFIDLDGGLRTAVGLDFIRTHGLPKDMQFDTFLDTQRDKYGVVTKPQAFDKATEYFEACMKPGSNNPWTSPYNGKSYKVGRDTFDTWVIDTGTTLSEAAASKAIWLLNQDKNTGGQLKGVKSETHGEALKHGLIVMKQQDYGSERSLVEQFVGRVMTADKHVIFLCHEKELSDETGNVKGVVPLLTGKGVESVCLMFDEIWHVEIKGVSVQKKDASGKIVGAEVIQQRILRTHETAGYKCGTRLGIPNETPWDWQSIQTAIAETKQSIANHLQG